MSFPTVILSPQSAKCLVRPRPRVPDDVDLDHRRMNVVGGQDHGCFALEIRFEMEIGITLLRN